MRPLNYYFQDESLKVLKEEVMIRMEDFTEQGHIPQEDESDCIEVVMEL